MVPIYCFPQLRIAVRSGDSAIAEQQPCSFLSLGVLVKSHGLQISQRHRNNDLARHFGVNDETGLSEKRRTVRSM